MIDEKTILVTHVPPYNTVDKIFIGLHGGSKDLRALVDKFKPRLVISGHIHENPGFKKINDIIFVNCSMGKCSEGAIIEINQEILIKILE